MEAETLRMPEKHANDAPPKESPPPAILRPAPAPPNAEEGLIEKSRSQKRHRRKYEYWERVQTATTRKLGACTECRRKKYRCHHGPKQQATDQPGPGGAPPAPPALQRSESQDSWCSVASSLFSESSNVGDCFGATSVNAIPSTSVDQPQSSQWAALNRIMDSDNRYKEYGVPSTQAFLTSPPSGLAPHGSYRSSEPMSQGDTVSQNNGHLSTEVYELTSISPSMMSYFPDKSEPWSQTIQSNGGDQRPEYLTNLRSPTLPSSGFQPTAPFHYLSTIHNKFTNVPGHAAFPGYSPSNAVVSEPPQTIPQARVDSSTRWSPTPASPGLSGTRVQTVPGHFVDHMPSRGPLPQTPGSWLNMRTPEFLPEGSQNLSWDSQQLLPRVQGSLGQIPVDSMEIDLFGLTSQSQVSFGANTSPQYGVNTFEGSSLPSPSSNGTDTMMNRSRGSLFHQTTQFSNTFYPSTLESPRSSSDILSSQLDNFSNEPFLHGEPVSNPPQTNSQISHFENIFSPPPLQTPQSGPSNISMSRCSNCDRPMTRDEEPHPR